MADIEINPKNASVEQLAYATWLDWGMRAGFLLLVASFLLYVSGIVSPHIPLNDLPQYWSLPVNQYLEKAGVHNGWGWLSLVGKGDFLNFIGVAFLSAVTIFCYLRIIPILIAQKDRLFVGICVIEVLVLVLAASGILAGGH